MTDDLTPNGLARLARSAAAYHLDKALRARDRIAQRQDAGAGSLDPIILIQRIVFRVNMYRARRRLVHAATAETLSPEWCEMTRKRMLPGRTEWVVDYAP